MERFLLVTASVPLAADPPKADWALTNPETKVFVGDCRKVLASLSPIAPVAAARMARARHHAASSRLQLDRPTLEADQDALLG